MARQYTRTQLEAIGRSIPRLPKLIGSPDHWQIHDNLDDWDVKTIRPDDWIEISSNVTAMWALVIDTYQGCLEVILSNEDCVAMSVPVGTTMIVGHWHVMDIVRNTRNENIPLSQIRRFQDTEIE